MAWGAHRSPITVSRSLLSSHTTPHTLFTCPFCHASLAAKYLHLFLKAGLPEPTFSCDAEYLSHRTRSPHVSSPTRPPERSRPATAGGSEAPLQHGPRGRRTRGGPHTQGAPAASTDTGNGNLNGHLRRRNTSSARAPVTDHHGRAASTTKLDHHTPCRLEAQAPGSAGPPPPELPRGLQTTAVCSPGPHTALPGGKHPRRPFVQISSWWGDPRHTVLAANGLVSNTVTSSKAWSSDSQSPSQVGGGSAQPLTP